MQTRGWAEFIALVAGTLSVLLPFLAFLPVVPKISTGLYLPWVLATLTLTFSFFARGMLRIAGIIVGSIMFWFWWEVRRLAEALAVIYGGS